MQDRISSIEIALENETKEREFYLENSRRTKNSAGADMFATIARDEEEHYNRLKELHEKLQQKRQWPEDVTPIQSGLNVRQAIGKLSQAGKDQAAVDADDIAAIKKAIEFETSGYNLYAKLRDNAETKPERTFFGMLASFENEHLNSLKESLLFFEDPATWYEQHEKPHFEA